MAREHEAAIHEWLYLPEQIRGFGHVKELNLAAVRRRESELLERFASGDRQVVRIQEAVEKVE